MKRHGAYLDDKQHGRDLSAAEQIRQKDGGGRVEMGGGGVGSHAQWKGSDEDREKGNLTRK